MSNQLLSSASSSSFLSHPFTPPKTISLTTSTLRNERTLIWLQNQSPSVSWWKWDAVVTSLEAFHQWNALHAHLVGIICAVLPNHYDINTWCDDLYSISKQVTFIMISRAILQHKSESFWRDNFDNLLCLEDLHESYPFLGQSWNGTDTDAIHLLALISRYHRVVDISLTPNRPTYNLTCEYNIRPTEFILYTQFYQSPSKKRFQELRECLRRNLKSKWVDRIVLLNEKDESIAWASFSPTDTLKIQQRIISKRLTYAEFFKHVIADYPEHSSSDAIVALINADIYVSNEMSELWRIRWDDRAACLLRWDDLGEGPKKAKIFGPRSDSQDVWIFSASSIRSRRWSWNDVDIPLGKPGCDNAILHCLLQQRFLLSNPSLSLKTYHLHNSAVRTYDINDTIHSPIYIHLEPTYLIDSKQEITPHESPHHICNETVCFSIRSSSMSNEITYCTMLEKEGRYNWEPTVENYYFEPAIPVYHWKGGAGVTPNGLVYDLYRIYTGRFATQDQKYNYWSNAGVDIFTPLHSTQRMFALPLENTSLFKDWNSYLLLYFSRYLRICEYFNYQSKLSYWIPSSLPKNTWNNWINSDQWINHSVEWSENVACWANEVVGYLPGPSVTELGHEEIQSLRSHYSTWSSSPLFYSKSSKRKCVVIGDNYLTSQCISQLSRILPSSWIIVSMTNETSSENLWIGASLCIVITGPNTSSKWSSIWMLPKDAVLLEFQQELSISGECQHVSHISNLYSWIFLLSKGSIEQVQEQVLTYISQWWSKNHTGFTLSNPSFSLPQ